MLLLVIVAFIATRGFFRRAKEIGIHPGKAASIPFIILGVLVTAASLATAIAGQIFSAINLSDGHTRGFGLALDWFVFVSYFIFIKRNWDTLRKASLSVPTHAADS